MNDPERFGHQSGESTILHRYRTLTANLNQQPFISSYQVRSLLELKEKLLNVHPTHAMGDLTFLQVTLDRWDHGNRLSALEHVFHEAFEEDRRNYDGYKSRAAFWFKCAEGLLEEPLCTTDHMYQRVREKIAERRHGDPELFNVLDAALSWNHALHNPNAHVYRVSSLYEQYTACRDELFGPLD